MPRAARSRSTASRGVRVPVKRTKTYVGCWTCRARGVKCDGKRPVCERCIKHKTACEGYGMRLVWPDSTGPGMHDEEGGRHTGQQRRLMIDDPDTRVPVLKMSHVNSIIRRLDSPAFDHSLELVEGPFSVFAFHPTPTPATERDGSGDAEDDEDEDEPSVTHKETNSQPAIDASSTHDGCSGPASPEPASEGGLSYSVSERLFSHLLSGFLSHSSPEERQLLRFWITSASGLMISTNHPANPFREVVLPLVLESVASTEKLAGHSALLHSIYAFAAFNRSQIEGEDRPGTDDAVMAVEHHQAGLRYLRQSMMQDPRGQYEAILASIILMTSIDIVAGRSGQWRIHLRGGREWLRTVGDNENSTRGGYILRQIFHCVEIVGYSHDLHTRFADSSASFFRDLWEIDADAVPSGTCTSEVAGDGDGDEYYLHELYGITKPVLRAIFDISRLSVPGHNATREEIEELQTSLLLANPSTRLFPTLTATLEKIVRHHACSWYYACMIHFERSLRRAPPEKVQHLVEQCLYHLEAAQLLEDNPAVDGLMWPFFVTACEASDKELRRRCLRVFTAKENKGVGANQCIEGLVREVWHRRDMNPEEDILRQQVMEDLAVDILLT